MVGYHAREPGVDRRSDQNKSKCFGLARVRQMGQGWIQRGCCPHLQNISVHYKNHDPNVK